LKSLENDTVEVFAAALFDLLEEVAPDGSIFGHRDGKSMPDTPV